MTEYDGIPDEDIWNIDFNELEFIEEIARGSFGKVFKGTYLGMDVAIKQILRHNDPAYMKYIEREISVLKGVRHPFIVGFSGVCLHETGLYIVTEFVSGGDVRAILKKGNVPWSKRIQIAGDLAKAMFYLHSKKIIHRDLKSKNLLIGGDGRVRLCDFGFARISEIKTTRAMTICGTPGFVAPEIMLGNDYSEACDVFSYGNVLSELITLERPGKDFWNRTADDGFQLVFEELIQKAPKDCPPKFLTLCLKCCEYEVNDRPDFAAIVKTMRELEAENPKEPESAQTAQSATPQKTLNFENPRRGLMSVHRQPTVTVPKAMTTEGQDVNAASYLQTISLHRLKLSGGEEKISEKHLKKMILRAINPDFFDSEYLQDILLAYPCFASPEDILNIIIERFTSTALESFTTSTGKDLENMQKKLQLIGIRIIVFLNTWIEKYPEDFLEPGMSELITAFDVLAASSDTKESYSIANTLEKSSQKATPIKPPIIYRGEKKPLDATQILQPSISANDLGRQITIISDSFFRQIKPREYLKETWKTRNDSNIKAFKEKFDELSRWLATAIVKLETKDQRASMISKCVDLAQQCLNLKNFNGFFAVLKALQHPSVERLKETWAAVKPQVMTTMKSFQQITSKDDHYKNYKSKQEASIPPSVPFVDPYLDEIGYIDSFNPDIGKGGIINFTKHRKIARLIRTLEQSKNTFYTDLHTHEPIQMLLLSTQAFDDDTLMKRSLNAEKPTSFG